jgi:guanyl-specific ribonuclease Sa
MARFPFPMPRLPRNGPPRRRPRRLGLVGALALLIAAIAGGISQCGTPADATASPQRQEQRQQGAQAPASPPVRASERPPERYETLDGPPIGDRDEVRGIWDTLRRVARGPPFPYRQDGTEFRNREKRLPHREAGWWREYTVETPGSPDRGARRLVIGADGEVWYTRDHYASFVRLILP